MEVDETRVRQVMNRPSAQVVRLFNVYSDQVLNTISRNFHTEQAERNLLVYVVAMYRMGIDPRSVEQQKARALLDVMGTWINPEKARRNQQ